MASRMLASLVATLLIFFMAVDSSLSIRMKIHPNPVSQGANKVTVSCLVDSKESMAKDILFIQIFRKGGKIIATTRKDHLSQDGTFMSSNFRMRGNFDKTDILKSFMVLTFLEPTNKLSGEYICEIFYKDVNNAIHSNEIAGQLSVEAPTTQPSTGLSKSVQKIAQDLAEFRANISEKVADLEDKIAFMPKVHRIFNVNHKILSRVQLNTHTLVEANKNVQLSGYDTVVTKSIFMDPKTGKFTCPLHGTYEFMVWKLNGQDSKLKWIVNGCGGNRKELTAWTRSPEIKAVAPVYFSAVQWNCTEGEKVSVEVVGVETAVVIDAFFDVESLKFW